MGTRVSREPPQCQGGNADKESVVTQEGGLMRRFMTFGPAFVVLVTAAVTLVVVPGAIRSIGAAQTQATVTLAQQALEQDDVLERLNRATRNIAAAVEPSVVHLDVSAGRRGRMYRGSSGSGWVFDQRGHIVTNAHVVSGSEEVLVQFYDGQVARGRVVGADPMSDIAVIKVDAGDHLQPARRATGVRVERGDRVFAFGSPFGFKFSMSEGIVSGLGRSARTMMGMYGISNFIQTDAAVNPGNSGGPLVDIRGRVVGMNVAIATAENANGGSEGQSAGISFAIPLATIETRVEQLIQGAPIVPGYLGVTYSNRPRVDRMDRRGVQIDRIAEDGPAEKAGLLAGDVITLFNGQSTPDWEVLRSMISAARPGDIVEMTVLRGDEELKFRATLGEMPVQARLAQLRPALAEEFGLVVTDSAEGPVVAVLIDESPASRAGFERGQLIESVGGDEVPDADAFLAKLSEKGLFSGKAVRVRVTDSTGAPGASELTLRLIPAR